MMRHQTCAALACTLLCAAPGWAQYPSRAVHIVVTVPPGGAPDLVARALGEKLASALGQPVLVENKPGSNGNIAAEFVSRARPDGHVLLLAQDTLLVVNPHLYASMPIDVQRDLVPVAALASHDFVLAVHPALPAASLAEFVALARAARPPLAYASGGNGSQHQLAMEVFKQAAGIDLMHVPYRGGAAAAAAAAAGEVAATMAAPSAAPLISAGRLRPLARTGESRQEGAAALPQLAGRFAGFPVSAWVGLFAPAGTPEAVIDRLREEVARSLADSWLQASFARAGGLRPLVLAPAEFAGLIRSDHEKYGQVIARLGLKTD